MGDNAEDLVRADEFIDEEEDIQEEVQLTQEEINEVGKASRQGYTLETLGDIIKRAKTFHSGSERLKSSDEVKADLERYFFDYMGRPAYVDKEHQIHVLVVGGAFLPVATTINLADKKTAYPRCGGESPACPC